MPIKILTIENQAKGSFAGGTILENKPIGFPQDGGEQKPYSNLFYWANAWSEQGGLIDEHPHKMFEIMSFVIEGEIQHYDSKNNRWISLHQGDAQIIRSGKGITHAERLMPNSRIFQIWFDPNIRKTMDQEATYNDYLSADMHYYTKNGISIKDYIGNGGPIKMDAEGILISELNIPAGDHQLALDENSICSYYLLKGKANIKNTAMSENDFFIVENENSLEVTTELDVTLFSVAVPQQLTYKTYLELVNN